MARNKSERLPSCPDPRVIVHPNMGEHRLCVVERPRSTGGCFWSVTVSPHGHPDCLRAVRDFDDLGDAIEACNAVPNRFWFETDNNWVGPVPPPFDPDIHPEAA